MSTNADSNARAQGSQLGARTQNGSSHHGVNDLLRDIAFTGCTVQGRIKGAFYPHGSHLAASYPPSALLAEHSDGSLWLYKRDGTRRPWSAS